MMKKLKVMTIFGTRPEAIKMAPLVLELKKYTDLIEPIVTVTAQHREMLDQVLDIFGLEPDYDLNMMKDRQTLMSLTVDGLEGLDHILKSVNPDLVLVHGDTTTTFISSLAAFYNKIPVGHVEAGLRTWDKFSPYPEEMNRQLTGILADLHFAPTRKAAQHLITENKDPNTIYITGNTAIDALASTINESYEHPILQEIGNQRFILMTVHRRENLGQPMAHIFDAARRLVESHEDFHLVYPVHLNPAVYEMAHATLNDHPRIHLIDPLDVVDFHNMISKAYLILTDSGGIQEEATALGIPVLVLRNTTERPEGVEAGILKLVGTDADFIFNEASHLIKDHSAYEKMAQVSSPYGDGQASRRIVKAILNHFEYTDERPKDFE
jgi:UDP-N-acetylglucosamine 2-epimerase (non-hydrolysing)